MVIIERSLSGQAVVFRLSGRIEPEDVTEVERLFGLEPKGQVITLDLQDLTLVDRETLRFLAKCQMENIRLENCPAYISDWIDAERGRSKQQ